MSGKFDDIFIIVGFHYVIGLLISNEHEQVMHYFKIRMILKFSYRFNMQKSSALWPDGLDWAGVKGKLFLKNT